MAGRYSSAVCWLWWHAALLDRRERPRRSGTKQAYGRPGGGSWHVQRLAICLALTAAACAVLPAAAQLADRGSWGAEREGVVVQIIRRADRAVVCLRSRPPVQLSGEYGVHASWGSKVSPKESIAIYTGQEYFTAPL